MACCKKCGKEYSEGTIYCARCGSKVIEEKANKKILYLIIPSFLIFVGFIIIIFFIKGPQEGELPNLPDVAFESDYSEEKNEADTENVEDSNSDNLWSINDNAIDMMENQHPESEPIEELLIPGNGTQDVQDDNSIIAQAYIDAINSGVISIDDMDSNTFQYEIDDMDIDGKIDLLIGCTYFSYDSDNDNLNYYTGYSIYSYDNGMVNKTCYFISLIDDGSGYSYSEQTKKFYEEVANCGIVGIYEYKNGEFVLSDEKPLDGTFMSTADYEPSAHKKSCDREQLISLLSEYL